VHDIEGALEQMRALGMTTIIVEAHAIAALHVADRAINLNMGALGVRRDRGGCALRPGAGRH
jgi:hypothetical protein